MKQIFPFYLAMVILFASSFSAKGSHATGAEIYYQCTSTTGVYLVTLKIYRDCSGVQYCGGSSCVYSTCTQSIYLYGVDSIYKNVSYGSLSLAAVTSQPVREVTQLCSSANGICSNCNTKTPGTFSPSVEVYTFQGTLNLSSFSIPAAVCRLGLAFYNFGRNFSISNIIPDYFYVESILNRCIVPCNSSPRLTNDFNPVVCNGQDVSYNPGAYDPDGDSLSYKSDSCYGGNSTPRRPADYVSSFSPKNPFPYLGAPNSGAPYPSGFFVDSVTGDIRFRPIGNYLAGFAVTVTQWKKSGSTYMEAGTVKRDIHISVQTCGSNRAPFFRTYNNSFGQTNPVMKTHYITAVGNPLCFYVAASDSDATDSTLISWNNPPELTTLGATFSRMPSSASILKTDSFLFCWTPPAGSARSLPYYFVVNAKDNKCAIRGFYTKAFAITVNATLPVTWNHFSVNKNDRNAMLHWSTANETNNRGFAIERSFDLKSWETIAFVSGNGTSNLVQNYRYDDNGVLSKTKMAFYRLKQSDFDGKSAYSEIRSIMSESEDKHSVVYPNPVDIDNACVLLSSIHSGKISVTVYDVHGKLVKMTSTEKSQYGNQMLQIDLSDLVKAAYFLKIDSESESEHLKFVKN